MCPRIGEPELGGNRFGSGFCGCLDGGAQGIVERACEFPISVVDAP